MKLLILSAPLRLCVRQFIPHLCNAVYLSNAGLVFQALQWHESGLDFADAFHLAQSQSHTKFYTFDEKFVKKAKGLTTCEVNQHE